MRSDTAFLKVIKTQRAPSLLLTWAEVLMCFLKPKNRGSCYDYGAWRNFCSITNKLPFFPSIIYPIAIVNDFMIPKLITLPSYGMNVCHREQKSEEDCEPVLKGVFRLLLRQGYFACSSLILGSGGKYALCHSINTS